MRPDLMRRDWTCHIYATSTSVPWTELRGLRNRIFHDYGNVDVDVAIDIVENDLPKLIATITDVLG